MAESMYVGKYGAALRNLQALEAGMQGQGVGPMGPQPVTGAFQPPQRYADAPSMPAFQQAGSPPPQGGVLAPPPVASDGPGTAGIGGNLPQTKSAGQVVSGLDKAERAKLRAGIRKHTGMTVDEMYEKMVKSGELAPPAERKPKAKEKLSAVAESLFRYMSHVGKMGSIGATGQATLETQGRRQALAQQEIDEENARAEARRGEVQGVLSARTARKQSAFDKADERMYEQSQGRQKHAEALELDKQQQRGADRRAALQADRENVQIYTDAQGNVHSIDRKSNKVTPLMVEGEEPTTIGQGAFKTPRAGGKRKVERPLKGVPGGITGATTLDPDTVLNRKSELARGIMEDRRKMRELEKRAKEEGVEVNVLIAEEVEKLVERLGGGSSGRVIDFSELPD